jgi:phage gp45-like
MRIVRILIDTLTSAAQRFPLISGSGRDGETFSKRLFMQHYGFQSRPKKDAESIAVTHGNVTITLAEGDRRSMIELKEGEIVINSYDGDRFHIKEGRKIEIVAGSGLAAGEINVTANGVGSKVIVDATNIELGTSALESVLKGEAFMNWFNSHTHTGGFVSPTSPPVAPATALLHLSTKVKAE